MSKLIHTERGRVMLTENEEITRWRQVRKRFTLSAPAATAKADLWVMLCEYKGNREPLRVSVNGRRAGQIKPETREQQLWRWRRVAVPARLLKKGVNTVMLQSDNQAMNAWVLAVEAGHRSPKSAVSVDQGRTWSTDHIGARGMLRGEYVMRLRSHAKALRDPSPRIVYEKPKHARVQAQRDIVPARIRNMKDPWKQTLALRSWVAQRFIYCNSGVSYSPWDPQTIFDWADGDWGHGKATRVTMCVHYAAAFVALAASLGLKARCNVITVNINTPFGHFVSEVWDPRRNQWVMHDPNYDVHFERSGEPMSIVDICDLARQRKGLRRLLAAGPGFPDDKKLVRGFNQHFVTGSSYRLASVWQRNNYLSDVSAGPPAHGSVCYCETDILWYTPDADTDAATGMFPSRSSDRSVFEAPPR